jgi:hypothetical protein
MATLEPPILLVHCKFYKAGLELYGLKIGHLATAGFSSALSYVRNPTQPHSVETDRRNGGLEIWHRLTSAWLG